MTNFSIITPTYNRAHTLPRAIESVLKQTFLYWELIIVDDGSIDNTKEVISKYNDERIKYIYQENRGVCSARNNGISKANGKYLTFLDSDDYVTNDWLYNFQCQIKNKEYDLVFCDMKFINLKNNQSKLISANDPYNLGLFSTEGFFMPGTFCILSNLLKKINGFDEKIKFGEFTDIKFSLIDENLEKGFTSKVGLIYESSLDGGSKNYENKINSNLYLIEKHLTFFKKNSNVLRLYYQNIGIAYFNLKKYRKSRFYLWKAWKIKPFKLKTLIRLILTFIPKIAKQLIK